MNLKIERETELKKYSKENQFYIASGEPWRSSDLALPASVCTWLCTRVYRTA